MCEFTVNQTIKINNKKFTITNIDYLPIINTYELTGSFDSDPSFLKGKRTVVTMYLFKTKNTYKYDFNAK